MKRKLIPLFLAALLALLLPTRLFAIDYSYDQHGFTITFPDNYHVIDATNTAERAALTELYDLSPTTAKDLFQVPDQVILGLRSDRQVIARIMISTDKLSEQIWTLDEADDDQLKAYEDRIIGLLSAHSSDTDDIGQTYIASESDTKFLKMTLTGQDNKHYIYYSTVHNGKYYDLKFENFDFRTRGKALNEIDDIYQTFSITEAPQKRPASPGLNWVVISAGTFGIILILSVVLIIVVRSTKSLK